MTKLPAISGKKAIKALGRAGFYVHHQKGSHVTLCNEDNPKIRVVVPLHHTVKKGTLKSIIRDTGLTVEEFVNLL